MITPTGQNLVFLLSTPRAGSTLLSVLLNQLPGVLCPPEPWFLLRLLALGGRGDPDAAFDDEFAALGTAGFLGSPVSPDPIRAFAACAYNEKLAAAGKSVFVDKTPRYYHALAEIKAVFPEARFIWLQRNPLDVAASYKTTWSLSAKALLGAPARPETLDFVLGLDVLKEFFSTPRSSQLVLRYEDLVADPAAVLKRLQGFLGIKSAVPFDGKISRAMLSTFTAAKVGDPKVHQTRRVHAGSIDRWRSTLTAKEVRLVLDTLGPAIFQEMGHGSVVAEATAAGWTPPTEGAALQRRKLLRRQLPKRLSALAAEQKQLQESMREQAAYAQILKQERDRLGAEAKAAHAEAKRAVTDGQKHIEALTGQLKRSAAASQSVIDQLKAQLHQAAAVNQSIIDRLQHQLQELAATARQQGEFITNLEKERDRFAGEAQQVRADLDRTLGESQRHIEKLQAQLSRTVTAHQEVIDALRVQLDQLAATNREQGDFIATLSRERDRLAETQAQLSADGAHYVKVISEQTAYIALLEQQRNRTKPDASA